MGMSKAEFIKANRSTAVIAEDSAERTVYKIVFNEHSTLYYYFVEDKLVRVDEGEPKPDVVIEHTHSR